jgi:RNA polymerase sigma-70 factor (ECF subfamily)
MGENLAQETDEQLAKRAKEGEEAFSVLYERYMSKIFAYVSRRVGNRADAEDIVSAVFMRVVENIKSYNSEKSHFKTWLYTIATNMMIDYFRTTKKRSHEDIEVAEGVAEASPGPASLARAQQNRELVHRVIAALPERHQQILLLKYFSDLSLPEIAETLDVTPNNAGVMINRALKSFQLTYQRYA